MARRFAGLDELYRSTLEEVLRDHEFRNSPRGQAEREIIGYSARLENPLQRFCRHPGRRQNIVFNYAEALWYLSGRNDLEFIGYYAPSIACYSADGVTLPGTGYGRRLLHFGTGGLDQVARALDILAHDDHDSKRVFLQIFDAGEDLYRRNIDVSCTLGLQLLLREDRLHMVAFMRANDAYVGLLNDVFSFTLLQEYLASALGCRLGTYTHHVGSMHIYDRNLRRVEELLQQRDPPPVSTAAAPRMPAGCGPDVIGEVLAWEAGIRMQRLPFDTVRRAGVDAYWLDVLTLFWIHRALRAGEPVPGEALACLHPLHRDYVVNRWGGALAAPAARSPRHEDELD
jgi:thymidylate synthase